MAAAVRPAGLRGAANEVVEMRARTVSGFILAGVLSVASARAEEPVQAPAPADDEQSNKARAEFTRGVELVKNAHFGDALVAFEASARLRPHPVTTFNMGACQRAMSHYTLARATLERALAEQKPGSELPPNLAADAQGFLQQIEATLARVPVTLKEPNVSMAVDGRPLAPRATSGSRRELVAGLLPAGKGTPAGLREFDLILDPGVHVITVTRKGYADAVINRNFSTGKQPPLVLELERLPATLRVSSNVTDAIVRVNGADMGPVPVDVLRPAGTHRVLVTKSGYEDFESVMTVSAGEQSDLRATLSPERVPLTKRWWFWAGAGVVVVGGAVLTYALTREDPGPPAYQGGNTGWVAQPKGFSF